MKLLTIDFERGRIYRQVKKYNTYEIAGYKGTGGYIEFQLKGKTTKRTLAHRYIYEHFYGITLLPEQHINHINFIKDDNRIINLEIVNHQQNSQWRTKNKNNTTGFKGVCLTKYNTYHARIQLNGKTENLGTFQNVLDARDAYNNRARELNELGHNYFIEEN